MCLQLQILIKMCLLGMNCLAKLITKPSYGLEILQCLFNCLARFNPVWLIALELTFIMHFKFWLWIGHIWSLLYCWIYQRAWVEWSYVICHRTGCFDINWIFDEFFAITSLFDKKIKEVIVDYFIMRNKTFQPLGQVFFTMINHLGVIFELIFVGQCRNNKTRLGIRQIPIKYFKILVSVLDMRLFRFTVWHLYSFNLIFSIWPQVVIRLLPCVHYCYICNNLLFHCTAFARWYSFRRVFMA